MHGFPAIVQGPPLPAGRGEVMDRHTFATVCAKWGEPIAILEITPHPLRGMNWDPFCSSPDPVKIGVWKIDDKYEGGVIIGCTWSDSPDGEWSMNAGHRQAVTHLLSEREALRSQLTAAKAELEKARIFVAGIASSMDEYWPTGQDSEADSLVAQFNRALGSDFHTQANEILRLNAELERVRNALEPFTSGVCEPPHTEGACVRCNARAALTPNQNQEIRFPDDFGPGTIHAESLSQNQDAAP